MTNLQKITIYLATSLLAGLTCALLYVIISLIAGWEISKQLFFYNFNEGLFTSLVAIPLAFIMIKMGKNSRK